MSIKTTKYALALEAKKQKEKRVRARKALKLRQAGLTYEQIGKAMGFSRQRAEQLVKAAA